MCCYLVPRMGTRTTRELEELRTVNCIRIQNAHLHDVTTVHYSAGRRSLLRVKAQTPFALICCGFVVQRAVQRAVYDKSTTSCTALVHINTKAYNRSTAFRSSGVWAQRVNILSHITDEYIVDIDNTRTQTWTPTHSTCTRHAHTDTWIISRLS